MSFVPVAAHLIEADQNYRHQNPVTEAGDLLQHRLRPVLRVLALRDSTAYQSVYKKRCSIQKLKCQWLGSWVAMQS